MYLLLIDNRGTVYHKRGGVVKRVSWERRLGIGYGGVFSTSIYNGVTFRAGTTLFGTGCGNDETNCDNG